jgi:uncharacterized membrane protein
MSDLLFAAGLLIHTFGLIIWAGGEIWITVLVVKAQKSPRPHGRAFILELLHTVGNVMWVGLLLVFIGGFLRIIGANAGALWVDPGNLWGAMMLTKHGLIFVLVVTSFIITRKLGPVILANVPAPDTQPSETFQRAMGRLEKLSRTNLFLTIPVAAVGFRSYGDELPDEGVNFECQYCHDARTGGGDRNAFGDDFGHSNHTYDGALAALDSDGDGFTNGEEFAHQPVTNPGDADSHPPPEGEDGISPSLIFFIVVAAAVTVGLALIWRKR